MKRLRNKITVSMLFALVMVIFVGTQVFAEVSINKTAIAKEINRQYTDASRDILKLTQNDYTTASWDSYTSAITAAKDAEESEVISQEAIDSATSTLATTRTALVFAGKANLDTAKAAAAELTATDYVDYSAVTSALALSETTNALIVAKTTAINNAIAGLVHVNTALSAAKAAAAELTASDYADYSAVTSALALDESTNPNKLIKANIIYSTIETLEFAGQADLALAEVAAGSLSSMNYTTASWQSLTAALALPQTTNALVVAKTASINNARENLVFAGKADLDAAKLAASSSSKVSEDYTVASWTAFSNALALSETTNALIVAKTTAINNAVAGLVFAGQADLDAAKAAEAELIATDYDDYSAVTSALALGETTNTEVVAKTTAINNAIAGLVFAGKADLDAAKTAASSSSKVSEDYTVASWTAFSNAIALSETTNALIVAKTTAINNAVAGLVFAGQANLDAAKAAEAELSAADYADYSAVISALELEETTNALVVTKTTAINNAIAGLVFAGKADLDTAKTAAGTKVEEDYIVPSWTALTDALALGETTNALVVAKTTAINNAIGVLVFAGQGNLDTAKDAANDLTATDYVDYSAVTSALALGETTNALVVAKATAINNAVAALVFAGKADLDTAKTVAGAKVEADYTIASWVTLTDALAFTETTNAAVVAKTTAINNAIAGLEFAGQASLDASKVSADSLSAMNYTAASWLSLTNAIALEETTNELVVAKATAIDNAMDNLVVYQNFTTLTNRINSQYTDKSRRRSLILAQNDYTTSSWEEYMDAMTYCKAVEYDENSLQTAVIEAMSLINNAIAGLEFAGQADLDAAKAAAAAKEDSDYTTSTWASVTSALTLTEATNSEIVAKTVAINTAIGALVFAGQADLDEAMTAAGTKVQADYTTASWTALANAKSLAETTNALVVAKTTAINNAIEGLVFAGQANLDAAKAVAGAKVQADYTTASWLVLTNAKALVETTNTLIVAKATAINNAIANLVFVGKANLDKAKAVAATKVAKNYTTASWAVLTKAKALAETTNALVVAKTTAINNAIAALKVAAVKYKVIATTGLYCRTGAGLTYKKVTLYRFGTTLDILEIKNGWGRCAAGWVSMSWLKRV